MALHAHNNPERNPYSSVDLLKENYLSLQTKIEHYFQLKRPSLSEFNDLLIRMIALKNMVERHHSAYPSDLIKHVHTLYLEMQAKSIVTFHLSQCEFTMLSHEAADFSKALFDVSETMVQTGKLLETLSEPTGHFFEQAHDGTPQFNEATKIETNVNRLLQTYQGQLERLDTLGKENSRFLTSLNLCGDTISQLEPKIVSQTKEGELSRELQLDIHSFLCSLKQCASTFKELTQNLKELQKNSLKREVEPLKIREHHLAARLHGRPPSARQPSRTLRRGKRLVQQFNGRIP